MHNKFDEEKLKKQVSEIIAYSQNFNRFKVNIDDLLNTWKENKKGFIEAFNGNLSLTFPTKLSFPLEESAKRAKFDKFLEEIHSSPSTYCLENFILNNYSSFYENKITYYPEEISIPQGTKLIKSFKYFIKNKDSLRYYQDKASMLIQDNKIEGYFTISVHPLDFLSSSENTLNWRSCHALDGEYRSGNLSYMVDASTIICYLKENLNDDTILPHFPSTVPWNNKKWRMLLFVSSDNSMLFAGRSYPFENKPLRDFTLDFINTNNIFFQNSSCHFTKWHDETYSSFPFSDSDDINHERNERLNDNYIAVGYKLKGLNDLIINNSNLHYCDLLYSSCYKPYYATSYKTLVFYNNFRDYLANDKTKFLIGGTPKCVCCNKQDIYDGNTMLCFDCELEYGTGTDGNFGYCARCNARICYDFATYDENDNCYCSECAEKMFCKCSNCNMTFDKDDLIFDDETEELYCSACYEEISWDRNNSNEEP